MRGEELSLADLTNPRQQNLSVIPFEMFGKIMHDILDYFLYFNQDWHKFKKLLKLAPISH